MIERKGKRIFFFPSETARRFINGVLRAGHPSGRFVYRLAKKRFRDLTLQHAAGKKSRTRGRERLFFEEAHSLNFKIHEGTTRRPWRGCVSIGFVLD